MSWISVRTAIPHSVMAGDTLIFLILVTLKLYLSKERSLARVGNLAWGKPRMTDGETFRP